MFGAPRLAPESLWSRLARNLKTITNDQGEAMKKLPSKEIVLRHYSYCPKSGFFKYARNTSKKKIGEIPKPYSCGYIYLHIGNESYLAHRVAYMLCHKDPGEFQIDHINHVRCDNRAHNLRAVTNKDNSRNASITRRNKTGFVGVLWREDAKKFRSHIMIDGKEIHLGYFETLIDAVIARMKANKKHDFHKNHGML